MKKTAMLLLFLLVMTAYVRAQQAQLREMSGILLSSEGEPLPGVTISIKGSNQGTVSNIDGWYRIEAPLGAVLVYSFIGFTSYEVTVSLGNSAPVGGDNTGPLQRAPLNQKGKRHSIQHRRVLPVNDHSTTERGVAILSDSSGGYEIMGKYSLYNNRINGPIARIKQDRKSGKLVLVPAYVAKKRKPFYQLEFSTAASLSSVGKLPQLQMQYAQGKAEDGTLAVAGPNDGIPYSWGPPIATLGYEADGQLAPWQYGLPPAESYSPYEAFRTGYATDNHLQLFSKISDINLKAAYAHKQSSGILPLNHYKRHGLDFSVHTQKGALKPKLYLSHTRAKEDLPLWGANMAHVLGSLYTTPPSFDLNNGYRVASPWEQAMTYQNPDGSQRSFSIGQANHPYWLLHTLPDRQQNQKTLYGMELLYNSYGNLDLQYNLLLDREKQAQVFGIPPGSLTGITARLTDRSLLATALHSNLTAKYIPDTYDQRWGGDLSGSYTFRFQQEDLLRLDGIGFTSAADYAPGRAEETLQLQLAPYRRTHELMTKVSLYWNGDSYWHLLELMLANNMYLSNTLSEGDRAYFLPSISLAANLDRLDVFNYSQTISQLKPYLAFSRTVQESPLLYNQWHFNSLQLNPSDYRQYYQAEELFFTTGLKPEQMQRLEAGLSLGLFGWLDLMGSYYYNSTSDLILPVYENGHYKLQNSATLVSPGLELSLKATDHFDNGNWQVGLSFSRTRPYVKALNVEQEQLPVAGFNSISTSLVEDRPYGVLWGSRFLRNSEGQLMIDSDGYPMVNPEPGIVGNPNPDWLGGFSAAVEWHKIGFSFVLDAKQGGSVWNGTQQFLNYYGTSQLSGEQRDITSYVFSGIDPQGNQNQTAVDFYNPANPVQENRWQRYGEAGVAEEAVEEASWLRLGEIQLFYSLPAARLQKLRLQQVKFALLARNLFVLTPYSGTDPAGSLFGYQQARGLDLFNQPNTKSFGFALTINM